VIVISSFNGGKVRRALAFAFTLLLASGSLGADKVKLAFIGLEASGVAESTAAGISEIILDTLVKTHRFDVVERQQLEALLEEQALSLSGCTSTECMVEVGQLAGADKALVGTVSQVGSIYTLTLRLADVTTGKLEYSDSAESLSLEDLLNEGRSIVQRFAESIPVTGMVIGVEEDLIKVNLGTQENLNPGDEIEVYRIGEEYYDPDTGLIVGHDIIELGTAVVTRVIEESMSEAELRGDFDVETGDRVRLKITGISIPRPETAISSFQFHLGGGYPFIGDFSFAYSSGGIGYIGVSVATVLMSEGLGLDPAHYAAQSGDTMISVDYDFYFGKIFRVITGIGGGVFFRSDAEQYIFKVKAGVEYRLSSMWGLSAVMDYYPIIVSPGSGIMTNVFFGESLSTRIGVEFYL
jgi:TolB-like protein